jgi:hypothetical protein
LLIVAQASLNLLSEMTADLEKGAVDVKLALSDGAPVVSVVARDGKLFCKLVDGRVREIVWRDLPPDQILSLSAALTNKMQDGPERQRRIESAVAFDWLAGDRKRALSEAVALGERSADFRSRWEAVAPGLPE